MRMWPPSDWLESTSSPHVRCGRAAGSAFTEGRVARVDWVGDDEPTVAPVLNAVRGAQGLFGKKAPSCINYRDNQATAAASPLHHCERSGEVRSATRTSPKPCPKHPAVSGSLNSYRRYRATKRVCGRVVFKTRQTCVLAGRCCSGRRRRNWSLRRRRLCARRGGTSPKH